MENASSTKLVFIVFDQGVEPDVMDVLKQRGLQYYTSWGNCSGAGTAGVKQGTPVWPGLNTVVMVVMEAEELEPLRVALHEVRDSFPITPGLKLIITDAVIV